MARRLSFSWYAFVVFAFHFATCSCSFAQSEPGSPPPKEVKGADREQTIYVPYGKLPEVFERAGRGVFIPYEKFQELWLAARVNTKVAPPTTSPVDALIIEADSVARVEGETVRVKAKLTIELLKKGWLKVPLRLSDAAILSAKIDDEPARIVPSEDGGYHLLYDNTSPEKDASPNRSLVLMLEYAKAIVKSPGKNSLSIETPQSPVNRWLIRVPESGAKVQVQPMLAAAEVPQKGADDKPSKDKTEESTVIEAFIGATPKIQIEWNPKVEGATGMAVLASVQCQQLAIIQEGVLRTRAHLNYTISRAELLSLSIDVPLEQKVINVFDANVRKWDAKKDNDRQSIEIELFEPARQTQNIVLEMERIFEGELDQDVSIPEILVRDVGQQRGVVSVSIDAGLRAEPSKRTGLIQMDMAELTPVLKTDTTAFAFGYSALPYVLDLRVEKILPQITAEQLVEAYLEPQQFSMEVHSIHSIADAGVFQLEFDLPSGFDIRQVRGHESPGAAAAQVEGHKITGESKNRLVVNFARKTTGRVGLWFQLHRRLDESNLLMPTGSVVPLTWSVPRAVNPFLSRSTGTLVLYAPDSLRVNPLRSDGMRAISTAEAVAKTPSTRAKRFPLLRETLSLEHADQSVSIEVNVERRKPMLTVRQLLTVRVESGVVKYEATFFNDVRYSGIRSLRIDIPSDLIGSLRNRTASVRETQVDPPPSDLEPGYVAWNLASETEWLGSSEIRLGWESKLAELEIGRGVDIAIPRLIPRGADRTWGQVVFTKTESIEVQPTEGGTGVRPIDPQLEIMPDAKVVDAARAFEFQDQWSMGLRATRYATQEVKRTSIERALLRMVVTRSQQTAVHALFRMRSARQRLAVSLPKDIEFDSQPLRIDGKPAILERGDGDQLFIPLAGRDPTQSFVLELRYTMRGNQQRLDIPSFPEDPAAQKVYISLYMPKEIALLGTLGPWTDEFDWSDYGFWKAEPRLIQRDEVLMQWVQEGVAMAASPSFQMDGTLYIFSTLNPAATPDAALRLVTLHEKLLAALVFGVLAIVGLLLLRSSIQSKLVAIALVVSLVLLVGIFAPILSKQILRGPMWVAVAIVGVLWITKFVLSKSSTRPSNANATTNSSLTPDPIQLDHNQGKGDE